MLTPQSVRVQLEGDRGEDGDCCLKMRREIDASIEAYLGLFFIFWGQFYSITVCPQSHSFCRASPRKEEGAKH